MRSKTVYGMYRNSKAQAWPGDRFVAIQAPATDARAVVLTPYRARQLGKALIQMADEVEEKP